MKSVKFIGFAAPVVAILTAIISCDTDCGCGAERFASHKHTFASEWSANDTHHWYAATCEHKDQVKDKAEHIWGDWSEPDEKGNKTRTCSVCSYEESSHEHIYSDDLTSDAKYHWYAATCEHTDQVKDRAEHLWGDGTETTTATCTTAGVMTYTCTCGRTKTEPIAAKGHSFSGDLTSDDDCHWHVCENCGTTDTKTTHTWGEWQTVTSATTTAQGSKKRECKVCNKTETQTIPMLGAANITVTLAENSDYKISYTTSGTQITVTVPALPEGVTYKLIVDNTTVYETNSFDAEGLDAGTHSVIVKFSDGKSSYLTFKLN